jgi:elongation factor 1 alpha-like protein
VVPQKTLARLARDAKAAGKGSFAFAWVLDQGASERSRCV